MSDDISHLFDRIAREIAHLEAVRARLVPDQNTVNADWVARHADESIFIDRLNSFGMQLGRTGESVTKKLLPRLLEYAGEPVGSVIDNLYTAHKVGWIDDPAAWSDLNRVRHTLIHEYLEDAAFMASQIQTAVPLVDVIARGFCQLEAWASRYMRTRPDDPTC